MSDYRIEKSRHRVVVTTRSGQTIAGEMFLQPFARPGGAGERPVDVLNGAEQFFPLAVAGDDVVLLSKAQVVHLSAAPWDEPEDEADGSIRRMLVEVTLVNGETHTASMTVEAPAERSRLLDFLNREHNRFVTLHGLDGLLLINRRVIERVRPLD